MDYKEKLKRLDEHIEKHPTDYQAVITRLKTRSDAIEHQMYLKKIARLKRVAEYRRVYDGEKHTEGHSVHNSTR